MELYCNQALFRVLELFRVGGILRPKGSGESETPLVLEL